MFVLTDREKAVPLFKAWRETVIWSCLQGVMGRLYVKEEEEPRAALAIVGDFCCVAGEPEPELLVKPAKDIPSQVVMLPQTKEWEALIEQELGERAQKITRFALLKEADFDIDKLQRYVDSVSVEYSLHQIDERLYEKCLEQEWSRDFVGNFSDFAMFQSLAVGVVALYQDKIVSGASAYSAYRGGIEVQIQTEDSFQRRGLAYACGAKLILACLERGLFPSWDARTQISVELAEKLGYTFSHAYTAYDVTW